MWGSHFFCKLPNDGAPVPLHQGALLGLQVWLWGDDMRSTS